MTIVYILTLLLLTAYGLLIAYYHRSFLRIPDAAGLASEYVPVTTITILVPARNEATNIAACLDSLLAQHYPQALWQCIVIDDHSDDDTAAIVTRYAGQNIRLVSLKEQLNLPVTNAYKKKAIETGVRLATGELIITTDADCIAGPNWLQSFAQRYESSAPVCIAAPVAISPAKTPLAIFEVLDFVSLQGITAAAVHHHMHAMGNGANLAYTKKSFLAVDGFAGIDSIASGDDMLLMHKLALRFPKQLSYLKNRSAIVSTKPAATIKTFLQQRIRWASKARFYTDKSVFKVLLLVYTMNILLLIVLANAFFSLQGLYWALLFLVVKTGIEWPFMHSVASFFGQKYLMKFFPLFQPLHILYTVVAGSFGQFGRYTWKGRKLH
jgi:cellulose synthase/poly-beta-1,6-N-acetylglucosamine synthase-like glycosyltransferase